MDLSKKTRKYLVSMMLIGVFAFVGAQNIGIILNSISFVIKLFTPFLLGIGVAFVLNVPMKIIEEKLLSKLLGKKSRASKYKRPISIMLTFILAIGMIQIVLFLIIPELMQTFKTIQENMPIYWASTKVWIKDLCRSFNISSERISEIEMYINNLAVNWDSTLKNTMGFLGKGSMQFLNTTVGITTSIMSGIFTFIMSVVFSIYMLAQKEIFSTQLKKIIYALFSKDRARKITYMAATANRIFTRFIAGQFLEALIIGVLCFVGMALFSFPYALMISVLVGFTALIPVFGAFIGTLIGAFLIMMIDPMQALWFIIYIIVLQQLEGNLIYPRVVGQSIGLPGIWVILAVLIGGNLAGAIGMLLGVPACSVIYTLFKEWVHNRLLTKQVSPTEYSQVVNTEIEQ